MSGRATATGSCWCSCGSPRRRWNSFRSQQTRAVPEARDAYAKAVELNPKDVRARNSYGFMLVQLRQPEKALEQFPISTDQGGAGSSRRLRQGRRIEPQGCPGAQQLRVHAGAVAAAREGAGTVSDLNRPGRCRKLATLTPRPSN